MIFARKYGQLSENYIFADNLEIGDEIFISTIKSL